MDWIIREQGFSSENIEFFGSKFCIGNGYFGYRGTLEEHGKEQLAACTVSEIFDDNGCGWREPVNLPNALYTRVFYRGKELSVLKARIESHEQMLELDRGIHARETVFVTEDEKRVRVTAKRFAYLKDIHVMALHYCVCADENMELEVVTGLDCDIWDANGSHFEQMELCRAGDISGLVCTTIEEKRKVAVAQKVEVLSEKAVIKQREDETEIRITSSRGGNIEFVKYVAICKDTDCPDVWSAAAGTCKDAQICGFEQMANIQKECWDERYENLGIQIKGDEEAQQAILYSCYLLYSSAPFHSDRVAIPARGLSGQVYKGAMFWDTEIYMLPMFAFCEPAAARNLMMYRIHNLDGARKKAQEYGYRGAFYPWESQEKGEDGCTHYNLTDIFTGRKMRTYFRDKQIHISADVVYGLWKYISITKDYKILTEGAAETILECVRFFYSYAYYKPDKDRYEFLDVTGADEYHERINNDAYTNYMIALTLKIALETVAYMEEQDPAQFTALMDDLKFWADIGHIRELYEKIYLPLPDHKHVIEQFDGYFKEEDVSLQQLYARIIKENEYLGSPCGLAVNTQIIKQADVVLLLSIRGEDFSREVKEQNWEYYEPRTEHGSSLSTCIYALLAAQIGKTDWAYEFLMKAARIDLEGNYKLYLGDLYIGGTHPAANGGTWMVTVQGFGGLSILEDRVSIHPHLPKQWEELEYSFAYSGGRYHVVVNREWIIVTADKNNNQSISVEIYGVVYCLKPGGNIKTKENNNEV